MSKKNTPQIVDSLKHQSSSRSNLPTDQVDPYMGPEDREPIYYKPDIRNRREPVLSWDREDRLEDLETSAYPLYIHEKVHPQNWVRQLQSVNTDEINSEEGSAKDLFSDFNGLPEDATYKWYEYEGNWQNRVIKGDSVSVMASLAAKEGYGNGSKGVQMFFFDPPFGIKFNSNFQPRTDSISVTDKVESVPSEPDAVRPFRDTYKNGIHSYLDQIYRIANYARRILLDTGSFFMQIGDENVNRCALILDEVFGAENRVSMIQFQTTSQASSKLLPNVGNFLLWYCKDVQQIKYFHLYEEINSMTELVEFFSWHAMVEDSSGNVRSLTPEERKHPETIDVQDLRLFQRKSLCSQGISTTGRSEPFHWRGQEWHVTPNSHWAVSHEGLEALAEQNRLVGLPQNSSLYSRKYTNEIPGRKINNFWSSQMFSQDKHYVVETAVSAIERCILMTTEPGDLVMDITCGSGTTAFVAEKWGRRWMTCDSSSVPIQLVRQRLLTGIYDWYLLANSKEGQKKEAELSGNTTPTLDGEDRPVDPSKGFVYERVPKVSAAILAYKQKVPPTLLRNKPIKRRGITRVSGPFTVESISPYRIESLNQSTSTNSVSVQAVVDALIVSGIAIGNDRVSVEAVEPGQPHQFLTHTADVVYSDQTRKRAVLAIVSDDQTVPQSLIDSAADDVARTSADVLIVIAFAFTADTRNERRYSLGRLDIIKAQANRDLMIPPLKNRPTDRAIVAIGDPEVKLHQEESGKVSMEICGWDTYDPSTGNVKRGNQKDVDTWLLDINYNGKSFYANRIHFPNKAKDRQLTRLKKAIARSLNPKEWDAVLSCRSTPFSKPETGQVAVRIITTTGTEMTTVINVN